MNNLKIAPYPHVVIDDFLPWPSATGHATERVHFALAAAHRTRASASGVRTPSSVRTISCTLASGSR